MAGNLFKAAAQDIGKQLSGDRSAAHGVMGFRMAKSMSGEADELKASSGESTAAASGTTPGASLAKTAGNAVNQATNAATSSNQPQQQPAAPQNPSENDQLNQGQA